MAQDFERAFARNVGTSAVTIMTSNSDDTVVGMSLANVSTSQITADVFVTSGGNDYYWIKNAPIPHGSALEVISQGGKKVLQTGDALKVQSNTASSVDVWTSFVDAIST